MVTGYVLRSCKLDYRKRLSTGAVIQISYSALWLICIHRSGFKYCVLYCFKSAHWTEMGTDPRRDAEPK